MSFGRVVTLNIIAHLFQFGYIGLVVGRFGSYTGGHLAPDLCVVYAHQDLVRGQCRRCIRGQLVKGFISCR